MVHLYDMPLYREDLEQTFSSTMGVELFQNKRILITGASGLIGSYLVDFFIYCNKVKGFFCDIYAAGRDEQALQNRFATHCNQSNLHILKYEMNEEISFSCSVDYIIHGAGPASPQAFTDNPAGVLRNTVEAAGNMLAYAWLCGVRRFLLLSSGEIYGQPGEGCTEFSEEYTGMIDSLNPRSCYPLGKRAAENLCASYAAKCSVNTVIARCCHTYGPTASNGDNRVASAFMRTALQGQDIIMKSQGKQMRSWCYVADCASGLLTALTCGKSGEAYNIAAACSRGTVRELAELVANETSTKVVFQMADEQEKAGFNPMEHGVLASDKIEAMGWFGKYSLKEGIHKTLSVLEAGR